MLGYDTSEKVLYKLKLYEVAMKKDPHLQRVQHLIEAFVVASIDLQLPSEKDADVDVISADKAMDQEKNKGMDRTAFYKWSKIPAYFSKEKGADAYCVSPFLF